MRIFNLYKQAQNIYWYSTEVAKDTKNPEILKKILEQGHDDEVARRAAYNRNCPPEALQMVLERGENNIVSQYAAANPNCPPGALKTVLEKREINNVSCCAALNLNCPPKVLEMVLGRGWNDDVSHYAATNPNCPPLAKIKWAKKVGRIKEFDPKIHTMQYEEKKKKDDKDDKDFEELVKLIKGKSFNLQKMRKQSSAHQELENSLEKRMGEDGKTLANDIVQEFNKVGMQFRFEDLTVFGIAKHDVCVFCNSLHQMSVPNMLFIMFHELGHYYQYKNHGKNIALSLYMNPESEVEKDAVFLMQIESTADKFGRMKAKHYIDKYNISEPLTMMGYGSKTDTKTLESYLLGIKRSVQQQRLTNIEDINEQIYGTIKRKIYELV